MPRPDHDQLEAAATMKQEVLSKRRWILGEDHPNTISAMNKLAATLRNQGKPEEAALMLGNALRRSGQAMGENHPSTQQIARNLSIVLHLQGDLDRQNPPQVAAGKGNGGDDQPDRLEDRQ